MVTQLEPTTKHRDPVKHRDPLTRERVLDAAVKLADESGIEALSMRKLGQELGVEAMSLYNHVENKEDILDGMVDVIVSDIDLVNPGPDWKSVLRSQIVVARTVMSKHTWAPQVIETRKTMSAPTMSFFDSVLGIFIEGGFSVDLMHHAVHALGSRLLGFSQELYDDSEAMEADPAMQAVMLKQMADAYPNITKLIDQISHDEDSIVGSGCDDDLEFVFSVDLILDGLERARAAA